jgi:hemolysin activation/secretion protein
MLVKLKKPSNVPLKSGRFDGALSRLGDAGLWAGLLPCTIALAQLCAPGFALAQVQVQAPAQTQTQTQTQVAALAADKVADNTTEARFTVTAFYIEGVTLVKQASLQAALKPWLNKPITTLHLQHAARTMADVYRAEGWPMRPQVPVQEVVNGEVHFSVVETRLLDAAKADQHLAELASLAQRRNAAAANASAGLDEPKLAALTRPDAGGLLRELRRDDTTRQPVPLPARPLPAPAEEPTPAVGDKGPSFNVKGFRFAGVSLVNEAALQLALSSLLNRPIVFEQLQTAVQVVADVYRSQGWLARPQLPAQDLVDGVVQINVVEARLGQVRIDDLGVALRFDKGRLLATLQARQQPDQPLNLRDVERAVQVLNNTTGLRAEAMLAPGGAPGQTDVVLRAQDQALLSGQASVDNQGARSTGAARASASLALRDATGAGDEWVLNGQTTGAGNFSAGLNASLPVGHDGLRLAASFSELRYRLQGEFAAAHSEGSARTLGLQARYPLGRSVFASLGFERRTFDNSANAEQISHKRLHSLTATVSGDGATLWPEDRGFTQWSVSAMAGELDLSANTAHAAADEAGPRAAGRYTRWNLGLTRLQPLTEAASLYINVNAQWASKNLDSADKFSLGGANGVRAYPGLEAPGDSAWLASLEWRQRVGPGLQVVGFYDHGQVLLNQQPDFAGAPSVNRIALKGVGLGVNWSPGPRYSLRLQVARRLGANPLASPFTGLDTDGSYSLFRAWLSLNYLF